jgi:hypothetical protein
MWSSEQIGLCRSRGGYRHSFMFGQSAIACQDNMRNKSISKERDAECRADYVPNTNRHTG